MQAIRLIHTLDSDTLYLPQLRPFVGTQVEIIVLSQEEPPVPAEPTAQSDNPLIGSMIEYSDPFEPAVPADEWEACR
jgi:hypothetical protein